MSTSTFDGYLKSIFAEELDAFLTHPEIPAHVRTNTLRTTPEALERVLARYQLKTRPTPIPEGFSVSPHPSGRNVTACLHHFLGHFFKQSLGSMLPALLLAPKPGERVLDLCAAPGSKTTHLAALMEGRGELWANDVSGTRMNALAARIDASTTNHVIMTNVGGEQLPQFCDQSFDKILVDVPCTGLGRQDQLKNAKKRFDKRRGPSSLPSLQYRLLLAALKLLKPGGTLVYSTCSLSPAENEAVVHEVLTRFPVETLPPPELPGLHWQTGRLNHHGLSFHPGVKHGRRVRPWEIPSEGFFAIRMRKLDELGPRHQRRIDPQRAQSLPTLNAEHPEVSRILENLEKYYGLSPDLLRGARFFVRKEGLFLLDPSITHLWTGLHRAGAPLARRRGAIWRMSHSAIQRFGAHLKKNLAHLAPKALAELCEHGRCPWPEATETPYPVLCVDGLGPIASLYDEGDALRWKRAQVYLLPEDLKP